MIKYDVNDFRSFTLLTNPTLDFDAVYTFYYDETNNIRKFYVKEGEFNRSFQDNFVLGGVFYDGLRPDITHIFDGLNIQANVSEVKLKHIAHGQFEDCLKFPQLDTFLKRIFASQLYLHYSSLNFLYWSIVDIVDSAVANSPIALKAGPGFIQKLKSDLYSLCKLEIDEVIQIFYQFKYPNLASTDIIPFIHTLYELFEPYLEDHQYHFGLTALKQILRESERAGTLPFIEDEQDHMLLKDFSSFYLRPIWLFKNSTHIFDNEPSIKETIDQYNMVDGDTTITSYSFVESHDDILIQVSDVLVGLIGKFTTFVNSHSIEQIEEAIHAFSHVQLANLDNFLDLVIKSDTKNPAVLNYIDGIEDTEKRALIFELRAKA